MKILRHTLFLVLVFVVTSANTGDDLLSKKKLSENKKDAEPPLCKNVIGVLNPNTSRNENYIFDPSIYELRIDTLPQIKYWRTVMNLGEDSALVCFAHNRNVIDVLDLKTYDRRNEAFKKSYRDSLKCCYSLDSSCRVLVTGGKRFFYDFDKASVNFQRGIHCFIQNEVDPWYAQAILLIESPNKLQKSNVGAYGPFQLMKDVARLFGLKVNRQVDERADFERSAYAASSLIKKVCIPRVRQMLDSLRICEVNETDLWFRLLVMHVYHAGFYNVQKALFTFNPSQGNMDIIYNLWKTQAGKFKMASQNYSQLVLAAMIEMDKRSGALNQARE